jgi:UDP-glucuronate 4-epimerase
MRVLVTGGAGFIGSHLSERLLREGHEVVIVDDLNDYYSPALKMENLASIRSVGPVIFEHSSICDEAAMTSVFAGHRPELVIHLAARAGIRPSLEQPLLYEHVNVRGTTILLEACRKMKVPRLIFASSSSIYGASSRVPFRESDPMNRPLSPYAATKLAGENMCYTYSHLYGIQTVCLRFFTVYGPRQRPDLAICKFTDLIARGEPIPVFGTGASRRDYTFVEDIVEGIMAAIRYDCPYDIFNLGNSSPVDLRTLIRAIETAVGKTAHIRWLPEQAGDVPITYADITKAAKKLGYCPRTQFTSGIQRFVDWYQRAGSLNLA